MLANSQERAAVAVAVPADLDVPDLADRAHHVRRPPRRAAALVQEVRGELVGDALRADIEGDVRIEHMRYGERQRKQKKDESNGA